MTLVVAETGEVVGRSIEELEEVIGRGLETFVEVGEALAEVRDARLYLQFHPTFEEYCTERWGLKRQRAYELIDAASVAKAVSEISDTPPVTRESHAKALAPLRAEPERAAEAMRAAAESTDGKPTAKAIAEAVKSMVEAEVAKAERKAEDASAIRELNERYQPEGFDAEENRRLVTERGHFSRLCREMSQQRSAGEFVAQHRSEFTRRHIDQAERAYAWLDEFLLEFREGK